ncbi:MAG TPA: hypothetical protein PLY35_09420 [Thermotogota bacterium]|nr:hypothetical protein [Thermotogota bacterium]
MKQKYIIYVSIFIIILNMIYIGYKHLYPTKVIDIQYLPGKPDTTIIKDTIYLSKAAKKIPVKWDTLKIYTIADSIKTDWSDFKLQQDSLTGVLGRIRIYNNNYEFDSVKMFYPYKTILKVDTIKINNEVFIETSKPLYKNEWFYVSIITAIITIIK